MLTNKQIKDATEGITYDEFFNNRLKPLYSRKKQYKKIEQLYSRVEYELMNYLKKNSINEGSREEKKLIVLLKASISDVRSSDTISMGGLIIAFYGIFIAVFPIIYEKTWARFFCIISCIAGCFIVSKAQKWFDYSSKKIMVLNICLNILVDK